MPSSGVQSPEQAEPIVGAPAKLECGVGCHRELIWPHSGRKGSPCPSLQAGSAVGALGLVQPVPLTVLSASCWGLPVSGWLWWKCFSVGPSGDHWQQCKASTGPLGSAPPRVSPSHLRLGPGKHEVRVRKNPDGVFSSLGEVTECGGRGWGEGAGHSCPFRQVRAICNQTYDLSGYQLGLHSALHLLGPRQAGWSVEGVALGRGEGECVPGEPSMSIVSNPPGRAP